MPVCDWRLCGAGLAPGMLTRTFRRVPGVSHRLHLSESEKMEFSPSEVVLLLLATIGPLKVTLVAASLTAGASTDFVNRVAARSVVIASVVCLVFAVLGEVILGVFKVSVPAFEIAGGIIVLIFSIDMVIGDIGKDSGGPEEEKSDEGHSLSIAVSPLAIPLMASVSGLVAIVSVLAQNHTIGTVLYLSAVIAGIMLLNYLCLRYSAYIVRAVGPSVFQVVGKLTGVILAALAVELILAGLIGLGLIAVPR